MRERNWKIALGFGAAAAAWIGLLFFFSGQSGADSGSLSMRVARLFLRLFPGIGMDEMQANHFVRKMAHMSIFAVEGFLMCVSLMHMTGRRAAMCVTGVLCTGLAAANELHQMFSDGRFCSFTDVLIDSFGAFIGLLVAAVLVHSLRIYNIRRKNN